MATAAASRKDKIPCDVPCENVRSVLEWMNGNGQPGAKVRLAIIEDNMAEIKKSLDSIRGGITKLTITVLGAALVWLITVLMPDIIAHIH